MLGRSVELVSGVPSISNACPIWQKPAKYILAVYIESAVHGKRYHLIIKIILIVAFGFFSALRRYAQGTAKPLRLHSCYSISWLEYIYTLCTDVQLAGTENI